MIALVLLACTGGEAPVPTALDVDPPPPLVLPDITGLDTETEYTRPPPPRTGTLETGTAAASGSDAGPNDWPTSVPTPIAVAVTTTPETAPT